MHNNEPTTTLLQVLRDLSRTIEQMAPQQSLTSIERDLLLTEMQHLYARLLDWPVVLPKVAPKMAETTTEVQALPEQAAPVISSAMHEPEMPSAALEEQADSVTEEVMEQLAEMVEEAVEDALESGKEVAIDIQLQVAEKAEETAEANQIHEEAALEEAITQETEATSAPEPDQTPELAPAASKTASPKVRSMAFSLSGVLQKSGDSQLVMAHLKLKPIDDLKSGIGLNEKFLFIRELFNNDHLAYADAIEQLNASNTLEEAENTIAEKLLPVYEWDLETEATVSFLHLIFRRFAPQN